MKTLSIVLLALTLGAPSFSETNQSDHRSKKQEDGRPVAKGFQSSTDLQGNRVIIVPAERLREFEAWADQNNIAPAPAEEELMCKIVKGGTQCPYRDAEKNLIWVTKLDAKKGARPEMDDAEEDKPIHVINSVEELDAIKEKAAKDGKRVIVVFSRTGSCMYCNHLAPYLAQMAQSGEMREQFEIVYIHSDSENYQKFQKTYQFSGIPAVYEHNYKEVPLSKTPPKYQISKADFDATVKKLENAPGLKSNRHSRGITFPGGDEFVNAIKDWSTEDKLKAIAVAHEVMINSNGKVARGSGVGFYDSPTNRDGLKRELEKKLFEETATEARPKAWFVTSPGDAKGKETQTKGPYRPMSHLQAKARLKNVLDATRYEAAAKEDKNVMQPLGNKNPLKDSYWKEMDAPLFIYFAKQIGAIKETEDKGKTSVD